MQGKNIGTVVIVPPKEPETPECQIMRIFGMTLEEYVADFIRRRNSEITNTEVVNG